MWGKNVVISQTRRLLSAESEGLTHKCDSHLDAVIQKINNSVQAAAITPPMTLTMV